MSATKVAVLGLGIMGGGMAHQLLAKGFELTVYNRDPAKARSLAEAGARVATSPAEAVLGAQVVVAMLAHDDASRAVWTGEQGALAAMTAGAVAIDASTLTVGWVRELAAAAKARGVAFIDAPVTGSRAQAAGGELRFLVGGEDIDIDRAEPVLRAMGGQVVRFGPVGSGALIKLINNFLCGVQAATLAEALAMAERGGLDLGKVVDVLSNGAPASPLFKAASVKMAARDYDPPNFYPLLMAKDLDYAIRTFAEQGIELDTAKAARARFLATAGTEVEHKDMSAVIEPIRKG